MSDLAVGRLWSQVQAAGAGALDCSDTRSVLACLRSLRESGRRQEAVALSVWAVHERLRRGLSGNRALVRACAWCLEDVSLFMLRWTEAHGTPLPSAVKRGVSDLLSDHLDVNTVSRWPEGGMELREVISLVHARPRDARQSELYRKIVTGESLAV